LAIGHENNEVIVYFSQQDRSNIYADWYKCMPCESGFSQFHNNYIHYLIVMNSCNHNLKKSF